MRHKHDMLRTLRMMTTIRANRSFESPCYQIHEGQLLADCSHDRQTHNVCAVHECGTLDRTHPDKLSSCSARESMSTSLLRFAAVVALAFALPHRAAGQVCGDLPGKPGISGDFISLPPPPSKPFFYYRLGDYVVLVQPNAVRQELNAWTTKRASAEALAFRSRVLASFPLRENSDLYLYTLQNQDFWYPSRSLVVSLIEARKAAVSYTVVDNAVHRVYVQHYRKADLVATSIRLDKSSNSALLIWLVECAT